MTPILDTIMRDLRELSPPKLVEVSDFIHRLLPDDAAYKERRKAALRATSGCMSGDEGEDFERAARETADRIDHDEL